MELTTALHNVALPHLLAPVNHNNQEPLLFTAVSP